MKILIAEDDNISRQVLQARLTKWGYEVICTSDGDQAWQALHGEAAPKLAILDWMMPGLDGVQICRRLRDQGKARTTYVILLTAKGRREDLIEGLEAGADDYVIKPFDPAELKARVKVGLRIHQLQNDLSDRVAELEEALSKVKQLQGLLPICSYCKKVRDDRNYWQGIENYVSTHSEASFSHSICPNCYQKHVKPELEALDLEPGSEI